MGIVGRMRRVRRSGRCGGVCRRLPTRSWTLRREMATGELPAASLQKCHRYPSARLSTMDLAAPSSSTMRASLHRRGQSSQRPSAPKHRGRTPTSGLRDHSSSSTPSTLRAKRCPTTLKCCISVSPRLQPNRRNQRQRRKQQLCATTFCGCWQIWTTSCYRWSTSRLRGGSDPRGRLPAEGMRRSAGCMPSTPATSSQCGVRTARSTITARGCGGVSSHHSTLAVGGWQ
mmetsp:Transcript_4405/g.11189  ORF Transcript_4405/g.11189 Transcript_4405/m.11189 type:complete len:229 (+) Transcript_4405:1514-2200(+)